MEQPDTSTTVQLIVYPEHTQACPSVYQQVTLQLATEAAAAVICLTLEEKPAVALWYNGGQKTDMIIAFVLVAYLPPSQKIKQDARESL